MKKLGNTMFIQFKGLDDLKEELLRAFHTREVVYIQPKNVVLFDSIKSFRGYMTLQKIELLTVIANQKPKSIYELAKIVGRELAPVQSDCASLKSIGFIVFKREKTGRKSMAPRLKFNYNKIQVDVPKYRYELSFKMVG